MYTNHTSSVYELIKSLSGSEKRHFIIFARRHVIGDENTYVRLFTLLDKQKQYSEPDIIGQLQLNKKQLKDSKLYLQRLILKSLSVYHSASTIEFQLKEQLNHVWLLYEKGLLNECRKILHRARKVATKYEMTFLLLEIELWKKRLGFPVLSITQERESEKRIEQATNALQEEIVFINASSRLLQLQILKRSRKTSAPLNIVKAIPELKKEIPQTFTAKIFYYTMQGVYHRMHHRHASALNSREKLYRLWEKNPHQIFHNPRGFLSAAVNLFNALGETEKYNEAYEVLQKIKYNGNSKKIASEFKALYFHLSLELYFKKGLVYSLSQLLDSIEKELKSKSFIVNNSLRITLYAKCSFVYFLENNFRKALKYGNLFLNSPGAEAESIYYHTRLYHIMIHYEMGSWLWIENEIKSLHRLFSQPNFKNKFEWFFILFIEKLIAADSKDEKMNVLTEAKKRIDKLAHIPDEKTAIESYRFNTWIESKIVIKPMINLIKKSD